MEETWVRVFESGMGRKIFVSKREEVKGSRRNCFE
jgi:hypothetical protein